MCTVSYLKCENDGRTSEALLDSVQTTGSSAVGFQSESGADGLPPAAPSRQACLLTRNSEFSSFNLDGTRLCLGKGVLPQYLTLFLISDFVKKRKKTVIFIVTSAL